MALLVSWEGKSEPQDFVTCLICGHRTVTLARHLGIHGGLTAEAYRERFPGALIRCTALTEKRSQKAKAGFSNTGKTRTIECPGCGASREVGWSFAPSVHDARCQNCRDAHQEQLDHEKWADKIEGLDYVRCLLCHYRAENLSSHLQSAHPDSIGSYAGQKVATNSAVRDKTALRGKIVSQETRAKMSAGAGRWNKGLTKETNLSVAAMSEHMKGRVAWSRGLTKQDHPSLQSTSDKLSKLTGDQRHWSSKSSASAMALRSTAPVSSRY